MVLSKTCDYAIRAALYLALQEHRHYVPIREISDKLEISFHFLTKILQILTQQNIITSFKGPKGGVSLARPAQDITLKEIIEAVDGAAIFTQCVLGLENCGEKNPCPLHSEWALIRDQLKELFDKKNLADLASKMKTNKLRISSITMPNNW